MKSNPLLSHAGYLLADHAGPYATWAVLRRMAEDRHPDLSPEEREVVVEAAARKLGLPKLMPIVEDGAKSPTAPAPTYATQPPGPVHSDLDENGDKRSTPESEDRPMAVLTDTERARVREVLRAGMLASPRTSSSRMRTELAAEGIIVSESNFRRYRDKVMKDLRAEGVLDGDDGPLTPSALAVVPTPPSAPAVPAVGVQVLVEGERARLVVNLELPRRDAVRVAASLLASLDDAA